MDGTLRRAGGFGTAVARATLVMIALVAGGTTARAEAPTLRWKFSQGEVLHYQMDQKTVTELKIAAQNQDIKTTVTQIVETTWTVLSVDASGTAEMSQSIDRLRSKVEANFGTFEFDSKADKQPEGLVAGAMVPVLKAMIGQKFRYKISPQGELSDIQVPESLLKTLKETGPAAGPGMFSEDGLKNMIKESSLILPKESLDKPWTRQKKVPMPPIGSLVLDTRAQVRRDWRTIRSRSSARPRPASRSIRRTRSRPRSRARKARARFTSMRRLAAAARSTCFRHSESRDDRVDGDEQGEPVHQ